VHNRTASKTTQFYEEFGDEGPFTPAESLQEFVDALERPRRIIVMVKAGGPVDAVIGELAPLLDEGDIVIDAGNSHFVDTRRRVAECRDRGLRFVGTGVSGGEEGALLGPSIMPGGEREAYGEVEEVFTAIAAQVDGTPCCTYVGPDGAGHYVKMVHNGIEYADMQLIAEAYDLLRHGVGLEVPANPRHLRRVEQRRPRVVPDRDHRDGAGQDATRRASRWRRDRRPGRAEGHGPLDLAGPRSSSACR
jgi:6-phosphogluconate dehydrogenase